MNKDKLKKLIYDMEIEYRNIENSIKFLKEISEGDLLKEEFSNSLKYKYLSLFILYEDFISMLLKEYNLYKIGITVDSAIKLLTEKNIFSDEISNYLNSARLLRNRIGHRYKQPKVEVLIEFLEDNKNMEESLFSFIKSFN